MALIRRYLDDFLKNIQLYWPHLSLGRLFTRLRTTRRMEEQMTMSSGRMPSSSLQRIIRVVLSRMQITTSILRRMYDCVARIVLLCSTDVKSSELFMTSPCTAAGVVCSPYRLNIHIEVESESPEHSNDIIIPFFACPIASSMTPPSHGAVYKISTPETLCTSITSPPHTHK